ncbi:hypothetical protein ACP70R_006744 [Stipagrostis hirtigluma subsp. patula]
MAPPRVEEEEEEKEEEQDERWTGVRAGDELACMFAGLGVGQRRVPAAVARFWEEDAAAAAADPVVSPFLGSGGMDPYRCASAPPPPPPPGGAVREAGPGGGVLQPAAAWMLPPRGRGMRDTRRLVEGHPRRGCVLGPRAERGAGMLPPRGVLPGDHAYMAPPPPFLLGGVPAFNPQVEGPAAVLPGHDRQLLLELFQEAPETIVSYACRFMESRDGQRLFRAILRHCDQELREWIVARITQNQESFLKICVHRSDEVEVLIKSCPTRRSMLLLRDAMAPWMAPSMLALISDSNRLRVVQAFIQHSPPDISEFCLENYYFILEAVAKNCTILACQPNGLSLLQNCIERVTQEEKDNIFTKISYVSIYLAQNSCGNYIVQEVLKTGNPSHRAIIAARFRYNYVGLSRQKYGSRVVELCLRLFGEGERRIIVNELICYHQFRELVTHEFANFVLSTALKACNFPLRNVLANAILSQNVNQRNQHCTKIFDLLAKFGFIQ